MKVTCMQLGHPSLTKSSGGEGNTQMGLDTAVRARGEEGEGRSRLVRFSDFPIFPHARLVACWRRHAASCMSSLAKRWQLQHASGGQRGQLRTGLGVCGSVTAHGFNKDVVARCGVVGKRETGGCCGAMMGDRGGVRERGRGGGGTEYLRLHAPIFPTLRAAPEVQPLGLANRRPVSPQQTDTGRHDKPQALFPMWPIWKLEPPARLQASGGAKQGKNEDGPASRDRMERLLPDGPARPRRPARLLQPSKMQPGDGL